MAALHTLPPAHTPGGRGQEETSTAWHLAVTFFDGTNFDGTKLVKEHKLCEEMLRDLGWLSLHKRRLRDGLIALYTMSKDAVATQGQSLLPDSQKQE